MDAQAAKFLGAGIACLGMGLAAIGVGNIFGNFLSGACAIRRRLTASSVVPSSARRWPKVSASSRSSWRSSCSSPDPGNRVPDMRAARELFTPARDVFHVMKF